ncbi:MAG: thiamine-phosphate kinase [Alphaproteobacteria bacterium]|nr:MAG: thiamine-phosphate kinase [Alphaproteobacteria bacterium]
MSESAFIDTLRAIATHPAARDLIDDAAVLQMGDGALVLTHDMIVEGVHYLPDDPPADVAWKLVAVNLSDLAAKGARPIGVLLGFTLGDEEWDRAFAVGLGAALAAFGIPLLGGDSVSAPSRVLGLTALGQAAGPVPSRAGAAAGDALWVSGTIGDAGAGLKALRAGEDAPALIERYRTPRPRLEAGQRLAPLVSAMMDVSDGLLIDTSRMAAASECGVEIALDSVPRSPSFAGTATEAVTAGDDYELLFALAPGRAAAVLALAEEIGLPFTRIGRFVEGAGLTLTEKGLAVPLPGRLGYEHGRGNPSTG